jgi:hypothetical protein
MQELIETPKKPKNSVQESFSKKKTPKQKIQSNPGDQKDQVREV